MTSRNCVQHQQHNTCHTQQIATMGWLLGGIRIKVHYFGSLWKGQAQTSQDSRIWCHCCTGCLKQNGIECQMRLECKDKLVIELKKYKSGVDSLYVENNNTRMSYGPSTFWVTSSRYQTRVSAMTVFTVGLLSERTLLIKEISWIFSRMKSALGATLLRLPLQLLLRTAGQDCPHSSHAVLVITGVVGSSLTSKQSSGIVPYSEEDFI